MKKIKTIGFIALLSTNLFGLSLDEAINISLQKNLDIKASQYDYLSSKQDFKKAKSDFLPSLDLAYSYNNRNKLIGTQIKEDSTASATISYNLFNGLNDLNSFKSTESLKQMQKFYLSAKKEDIKLATKESYVAFLKAKKAYQTANEAYKLFNKQYEDAKVRYDQGLIPRNDLLSVEVNLLSAEQSLVSSKNQMKIAKDTLSNILGGYDLSKTTLYDLTDKNLDISFQKEIDFEKRSEVNALLLALKSAKLSKDASKANFMPKVDASYGYYKYGDDAGIGGRDGYPSSQGIFNVSASWNLYDGKASVSELKKKKIAVQKAVNSLESLKLDIKLQHQNALSNLEITRLNLETSKKALKQAKLNYEIVNNRFKEGLSSSTDLIDANYLLTQAKSNYNLAFYDKFVAIATLKRVLEIKE